MKILMRTKNVKENTNKSKKEIIATIAITLIAVMIFSVAVVAADASNVGESLSSGVNALKDILITLATAIGAIVALFGIFEVATSLRARDTGQQVQGFWQIASGAILIFASQILNLFIS